MTISEDFQGVLLNYNLALFPRLKEIVNTVLADIGIE